MRTTARRAQPSDLALATGALASAFATDPLFNWLIVTEVERRGKTIFERQVAGQLARPTHLVDVAAADDEAGGEDEVRAAAVWFEVDTWKTEDPPLRELLPMLYSVFGLRTVRAIRLNQVMTSAPVSYTHLTLPTICSV